MTESGDEYTGHAQMDFLDANWNVVFSTTSDVKGTRLETPIPATLAAQPAERKGVWKTKIPRGGGVAEPPRLGLILSREDGTWSEDKGTPPVRPRKCKRSCQRAVLTRLRPIGENGRQRVPAGVLLRTLKRRLGERIRSVPEQRGLARIGR